MMNLYQCDGLVTKVIHVKLEAENKQDAANKAFALFEDHGNLVLWSHEGELWTGPEEHSIDKDVEVSRALDGPLVYWDQADTITAKKKS